MAYASVLQHYIYRAPPSSINVWLQTPCYVFGALGEIWVVVTGLELAFTRAPENLKTVVASVFWVTVALGSALGIGLSPVSTDPYMVKLYAALAGAAFVAGLGFTWWFWEEMRDV
jgi:POT family proton-dependent oligopeptide transporter